MKFKTTKKELIQNCFCVSAGYCSLDYLLQYKSPVAYTTGIYGWNSDIYQFSNFMLVTGYRPFSNVSDDILTHEKIKEFEQKAINIYSNRAIEWKKKEKLLNKLLKKFDNYVASNIRACY